MFFSYLEKNKDMEIKNNAVISVAISWLDLKLCLQYRAELFEWNNKPDCLVSTGSYFIIGLTYITPTVKKHLCWWWSNVAEGRRFSTRILKIKTAGQEDFCGHWSSVFHYLWVQWSSLINDLFQEQSLYCWNIFVCSVIENIWYWCFSQTGATQLWH